MARSILHYLDCLNCFRRKPSKVIVATSLSSDGESEKSDNPSKSDSLPSKHNGENVVVVETQPPQIQISDIESPINPALLVVSKGQYEIRDSYTFPALHHEGDVVIRTQAVGLNPIDWKSVDYGFCLPEFPWITGREMAGVVEKVGAGVTTLKPGQRVWTSTYYRDRRAGCFQKYVTVPQHTVVPIPENINFEEASCLGVAGLTAAMSLWHWLEVPGSPAAESQTLPTDGYLLIWGGSAVTGQFAIQIGALAGLKVIAVTSGKTAALARQLGAAHCVVRDGKTGEDIVAEIRTIAGDDITRGIDLVGTETAALCLKALSSTKRVLFAPLAMISSKTEVPENIVVETVEMKQFVLNEASKVYADALNRLVEGNQIALPQMTVLNGGFETVLEGLERVKRGDMAGKKMVVRLSI